MPHIYELDKTKPHNRGKLLGHVKFNGTPQRMGKYNDIIIFPFVYKSEWREDGLYSVPVKPSDFDVKGFMYSMKWNGME